MLISFFFVIKVRVRCTAVVCLIVLYFVVRSLRLSAPSVCPSIPYTTMVVACHCHSISLFLLPGWVYSLIATLSLLGACIFFVVRNVLIITDTVIVRVVISRIFLFVKSKFTSPGCVKMRNPDLNFHHWISVSKTIQSSQSAVSQASKPTISTFLIVNK